MPSGPENRLRGEPAAAAEPAPPRRRGRALPWIKLAVSAGLYAVIFYATDVEAIGQHLMEAQLAWVAGGTLLYAAGQALCAYRWGILLEPLRRRVRYVRLLAFYFTGMFFNLFLPTTVGGDAVKVVLLARETGSPGRAAMSVFMDRNLGLLALLVIAAAAAPLAPPVEIGGLPLTALCALLLAAFAAVNVVIATPRAYALIDRLIASSRFAGARVRAASLYEAVVEYRTAPAAVARAIVLSFVFQLVVVGVVFLNARALDLDVPVSALAVFVPLISLAGLIPVTVNGLGVREALYILLFGQLGAPGELAVSLALLFLAVTLFASLPGGLVYALQRNPASLPENRSAAGNAALRRP